MPMISSMVGRCGMQRGGGGGGPRRRESGGKVSGQGRGSGEQEGAAGRSSLQQQIRAWNGGWCGTAGGSGAAGCGGGRVGRWPACLLWVPAQHEGHQAGQVQREAGGDGIVPPCQHLHRAQRSRVCACQRVCLFACGGGSGGRGGGGGGGAAMGDTSAGARGTNGDLRFGMPVTQTGVPPKQPAPAASPAHPLLDVLLRARAVAQKGGAQGAELVQDAAQRPDVCGAGAQWKVGWGKDAEGTQHLLMRCRVKASGHPATRGPPRPPNAAAAVSAGYPSAREHALGKVGPPGCTHVPLPPVAPPPLPPPPPTLPPAE